MYVRVRQRSIISQSSVAIKNNNQKRKIHMLGLPMSNLFA